MVVAETILASIAIWVGGLKYPEKEEILAAMEEVTDRAFVVDAQGIARRLGNIHTVNSVTLGAAVASVDLFPITPDSIKEAIRETISLKLLDINIKAFEEGMPGPIITTPLWPQFVSRNPGIEPGELTKAVIEQTVPMKRSGTPEDIAEAALFLVSLESFYITGIALSVDGGSAAR